MKKIFLFILTILTGGLSPSYAQDKLTGILTNELMRNFEVMKQLDVPVYYISLRVEDSESYNITGSNGAVTQNRYQKGRAMAITMRVGSPAFDNMHYSGNMQNIKRVALPDTDIEEEIKLSLWRALQQAYSEAKDKLQSNFTEQTTRPAEEDKSPDFSIEKASKYYEKPVPFSDLGFDENEFINKTNELSKVLSDNRDVLINIVNVTSNLTRGYFIDTDGASVVQNNPSIRIYLGGYVMADDGMMLQDYRTYFGKKVADLPDSEKILSDARELSQNLSTLKKSPKIDSYTGPVILSGEVSGVFFHEFFGHRVEGARMKSGMDAQTLKKKIGETVLPQRLSVTFDPTRSKYGNSILSGDYKYDDEGVRGQKVEVIKNGVLTGFLMSRIPIEGFSKSNGHGRGVLNAGTETRQSNMIIESTKPVTAKEMHEMFVEELKKRGLKFGYRIEKVSGGLTMTSSASANAFYLNPLIVYRVYVDGRPEEMVRGINIVGTPLNAFSQILAETSEHAIFNGMCGALSGSVPVSAVAPAMLIKELEFQKTGDSQKMDPFILERP